MFACPVCQRELKRADSGFGVAWICPGCQGRAVTITLLRKGVEQGFINSLWQTTRGNGEKGMKSSRKCPSCRGLMTVVGLPLGGVPLDLDVCAACQFIWFDARETEGLPARHDLAEKVIQKDLSPEAREAVALARVALDGERMRREHGDPDFGDVAAYALVEMLGRALAHLFLR